METLDKKSACSKCGHIALKTWDELTEDEKMVFSRFPEVMRLKISEKKMLEFCVRCCSVDAAPRSAFA